MSKYSDRRRCLERENAILRHDLEKAQNKINMMWLDGCSHCTYVDYARGEINKLQAENEKLEHENRDSELVIADLKKEIDDLKRQNHKLCANNRQLQKAKSQARKAMKLFTPEEIEDVLACGDEEFEDYE